MNYRSGCCRKYVGFWWVFIFKEEIFILCQEWDFFIFSQKLEEFLWTIRIQELIRNLLLSPEIFFWSSNWFFLQKMTGDQFFISSISSFSYCTDWGKDVLWSKEHSGFFSVTYFLHCFSFPLYQSRWHGIYSFTAARYKFFHFEIYMRKSNYFFGLSTKKLFWTEFERTLLLEICTVALRISHWMSRSCDAVSYCFLCLCFK